MPRAEATEKSPERQAVLDEAARQLQRLPTVVIVPLLPFLADLGRDPHDPLTAGTVRRSIRRWRVLQCFGDLRRMPAHRHLSRTQIVLRVADETGVPQRSIENWITRYNRLTDAGLAGGFPALVDRYGRPRKAASNRV